jgi:hypothetical protein
MDYGKVIKQFKDTWRKARVAVAAPRGGGADVELG